MTTVVHTSLDRRGLNHVERDPRGDVSEHMHKMGRELVFLARRQVGKKSRVLERSIGYRVTPAAGFTTLTVYALADVAYIHHEGTRPHTIMPRHGRYLRFRSGGRIVYALVVKHPGTRPNRFFTDNLPAVVLR